MPVACSSGLRVRSSSPAWGSAFWEPSMLLPRRALKPRPAAIANSARKARAATIQGSELFLDSRTVAPGDPTPAPQRWQNLAPGLSSAEHDAQLAPASGAPQLAQYRPVAVASQDGQAVEDSLEGGAGKVIGSNYSGAGFYASSYDPVARRPLPVARYGELLVGGLRIAKPGRASPGTWAAASNRQPRTARARRTLSALRPSCLLLPR